MAQTSNSKKSSPNVEFQEAISTYRMNEINNKGSGLAILTQAYENWIKTFRTEPTPEQIIILQSLPSELNVSPHLKRYAMKPDEIFKEMIGAYESAQSKPETKGLATRALTDAYRKWQSSLGEKPTIEQISLLKRLPPECIIPDKLSQLMAITKAIDSYEESKDGDTLAITLKHFIKEEFTNKMPNSSETPALQRLPIELILEKGLSMANPILDNPVRDAQTTPQLLTAVLPYIRAVGQEERIDITTNEMERSKAGLSNQLVKTQLFEKTDADSFVKSFAKEYPLLPALMVSNESTFVVPMLILGEAIGPQNRKLSEDYMELIKLTRDAQKLITENPNDVKQGWDHFNATHGQEMREIEKNFVKNMKAHSLNIATGTKSMIPSAQQERSAKGIEVFEKIKLKEEAVRVAYNAIVEDAPKLRERTNPVLQRAKRPLSPTAPGPGISN
jgi:hypothetical protein